MTVTPIKAELLREGVNMNKELVVILGLYIVISVLVSKLALTKEDEIAIKGSGYSYTRTLLLGISMIVLTLINLPISAMVVALFNMCYLTVTDIKSRIAPYHEVLLSTVGMTLYMVGTGNVLGTKVMLVASTIMLGMMILDFVLNKHHRGPNLPDVFGLLQNGALLLLVCVQRNPLDVIVIAVGSIIASVLTSVAVKDKFIPALVPVTLATLAATILLMA